MQVTTVYYRNLSILLRQEIILISSKKKYNILYLKNSFLLVFLMQLLHENKCGMILFTDSQSQSAEKKTVIMHCIQAHYL